MSIWLPIHYESKGSPFLCTVFRFAIWLQVLRRLWRLQHDCCCVCLLYVQCVASVREIVYVYTVCSSLLTDMHLEIKICFRLFIVVQPDWLLHSSLDQLHSIHVCMHPALVCLICRKRYYTLCLCHILIVKSLLVECYISLHAFVLPWTMTGTHDVSLCIIKYNIFSRNIVLTSAQSDHQSFSLFK